MKKTLNKYFPMIRTREKILAEIKGRTDLTAVFQSWTNEQQEEFLDFCSGIKGVKVLYDGIFKEVTNPEIFPERLEAFLSLLLKKRVRIKAVLPNDSVRLGAESSLLYTDIIVELEDGSLANIEIQKIGYAFPGQRSACYSSDHLLRQYKRVRGEQGKYFNYRNIKNVYTIIFFEQSGREFHSFPQHYIHTFRQRSDTGLELPLLQEYYFISLDIYRKNMENRSIETEMESWLAYLSYDEPERIKELLARFPKFKAMYQDIYDLCLNTEKVMSLYSKELEILDRNTVYYMVDEMQAEINQLTEVLATKKHELERTNDKLELKKSELQQQKSKLQQQKTELQQQKTELQQKDTEIQRLKKELALLKKSKE